MERKKGGREGEGSSRSRQGFGIPCESLSALHTDATCTWGNGLPLELSSDSPTGRIPALKPDCELVPPGTKCFFHVTRFSLQRRLFLFGLDLAKYFVEKSLLCLIKKKKTPSSRLWEI
jgi:hypothetical protein